MPHKVPAQSEIDAILRGEDMEHKFEPFERVLVRDFEHNKWCCDFFSHMNKKSFVCVSGEYSYCVPYEGNESLLGTADSPEQKHKYKWGDKVEIYWTSQWRPALYDKKSDDGHDVYLWQNCICVKDNEIRPLKED